MKNNTTKTVFATRIAKSIAAGQADCVIPLGTAELRTKYNRKFLKYIKVDELFDLCGGSVTTAYDITVDGFAFWAGVQATELNGYLYRHRLLALSRPDGCRVYAIPVPLLERKFTLPDVALADGELETYRLIADHITPTSAEYTVRLLHPAKDAVKSNRAEWRNEALDQERLGALLKQHAGWLFPVITAALDVQFRSFQASDDVPIFVYNFTMKKAAMQVEQEFSAALGALNLTVEEPACSSIPAEIIVQDGADLNDWAGCRDRIVILRTATGTVLRPLLDKLDDYHRQNCFGGVLPQRLSTVPIVRSRTIFDRADTVDIELPPAIECLTEEDLDLLRIAVARTLKKSNACEVRRRWSSTMNSRAGYRLNAFAVWRKAVIQIFLEINFPSGGTAQSAACDGWEQSQESQLRAEEEREKTLRKAIELLGDQSRFKDEIIKKPATAEEATHLLDDEQTAVAFRYTPSRGLETGKRFLIFSNASLLRLLTRVGLDDTLYDACKKRAAAAGLLARQSKPVKFGQAQFNGFWVLDEKL